MKKLLSLVMVFVVSAFFTVKAFADPMTDFYNGLSDIIESNMDDPDLCVSRSRAFIRRNIGPLTEAAERGKKIAAEQGDRYSGMSPEEMQRSVEEGMRMMEESGMMDAIDRFMQAMQNFTMEHPEHGEQIAEEMASYETGLE